LSFVSFIFAFTIVSFAFSNLMKIRFKYYQ
jgi:hypothetical protein